MSIAAAQYDKFTEQTVAEERVYTFTDGDGLLVYPMARGKVVPFWSSRSRLVTIQRRVPKYRQWQITEIPLSDFWRRLGELDRKGIQIGVNWSGEQLDGYDVPVAQLRASLKFWIDRMGKGHLLASS